MSNSIHHEDPPNIIITPEDQLTIQQERLTQDLKFFQARIKLKNIWETWIGQKLDLEEDELLEIHDIPLEYHSGNIIILNQHQSYLIARDQKVLVAFIHCQHKIYSPIDLDNPVNQCLECE